MSRLQPAVVAHSYVGGGCDPQRELAYLYELRRPLAFKDGFNHIHHQSRAFALFAVVAPCVDDGQLCGVGVHSRILSTHFHPAFAPVRGWAA